MALKTLVRLDTNYRFMENDYGVFLQRRRNSTKRYSVGKSKPVWVTVKMFEDLDSAFKAWELKDF